MSQIMCSSSACCTSDWFIDGEFEISGGELKLYGPTQKDYDRRGDGWRIEYFNIYEDVVEELLNKKEGL